jgi:hypothetical protein
MTLKWSTVNTRALLSTKIQRKPIDFYSISSAFNRPAIVAIKKNAGHAYFLNILEK